MRTTIAGLAAGALAVLVVAGCIIGDGDFGDEPLPPCSSYPDDRSKCGLPWDGHVVQTCGDSGAVETRLYFDRPEVPDSARSNVMELGAALIDTLQGGDAFQDTTFVCDRGMCRHLSVEMRVVHYYYPHFTGEGFLEFSDSASMPADRGVIRFRNVRKESCP